MIQTLNYTWGVLCRGASFDVDTNSFSLFGLLDDVSLKFPPESGPAVLVVPFDYEVVVLWEKPADTIEQDVKVEVKIEYTDPAGKILNVMNTELAAVAKLKRVRQRVRLNGMPVTSPGNYAFKFHLKNSDGSWSLAGQVPLSVAALGEEARLSG
jgi:hypothetical protein